MKILRIKLSKKLNADKYEHLVVSDPKQSNKQRTLNIHEMRPDEIKEKARIHALTWQETYHDLLPASSNSRVTPEFAEEVTRTIDLDQLVAYVDDKMVGYASTSFSCRPAFKRDCAEIGHLYVLKEYQGLGIGTYLIEAIKDLYPGRDLALGCLVTNYSAQAFYQKMGFINTGNIFIGDSQDPNDREVEFFLKVRKD